MDLRKSYFCNDPPPLSVGSAKFVKKVHPKVHLYDHRESADCDASMDVDVDLCEIYFLIMQFLSAGPCQKTFRQLYSELLEYKLLPRRYHAWYSRDNSDCREENGDENSFPLNYDDLVGRYSHIQKDHLVRLLKQLLLMTSPPLRCLTGKSMPSATDVPTLLGTGSFSILPCDKSKGNKRMRKSQLYLRWPHMRADQVQGLSMREIGGGFPRHNRAPSILLPCYAIARPSTMVLKMQNMKKLRGHRDAVYCAIFDRTGRYVITGSDDRLVKIWSMETAFCLASCRGHEGDITDLSVSSNNAAVASASNDFTIRVWRLPDGYPISVLRGHTGAVTAITFSPSSRPNTFYQLLSSSDDGTCRIWDARYSHSQSYVYMPKPRDANIAAPNSLLSASAPSNTAPQSYQILCCAYNANGTAFVTGSSDTFARVWSARKPGAVGPGKPIHEIDILAGHENDVNYVQFSGCAVASRSFPSDSLMDDGIAKFKNSWFNHDNIVTCSRDGSAIIWVRKAWRSHGKAGRWVRAYHLKVPPPPMLPQPTRGGPRQRLLPTPRGVNMIVWSLDNRFVLAAIMDNRICVWNANDGSLVHSLAGHTASTYVLDVHPFNPRIAMSAGYDGKAILWDIWEGSPIRVYEIGGRFKLVDGRFSQDGTSIVLSDDVGQIYLVNTGEGESHKDAKYDQFFLGDYRPLTQDTHGNVIDQETQLAPYLRNIQDTLCDSSMLPYPEPYQSMYQRRRLGALGIEWRPSPIKFAVGTDIGMGQAIQILPLPDLDVLLEPLPDYADAIFWEPENEGMNDDNDSEYNINEEVSSEGRKTCPSDNLSDSEGSVEGETGESLKDNIRRSKRKKSVLDVELMTSGKGVKKRNKNDKEGTSSRGRKYKNSKLVQRSSGKKPLKLKSSRPQRVAARNAINNFSQRIETSIEEEDKEFSSSETSDTDLSLQSSSPRGNECHDNLDDEHMYCSDAVRTHSDRSEEVKNLLEQHNSQISVSKKNKLVIKIPLRHHSESVSLENHPEQSEENETTGVDSCLVASASLGDVSVRLEKSKIRLPSGSRLGAVMPLSSIASTPVDDKPSSSVVLTSHGGKQNDCGSAEIKTQNRAKDVSSSDHGECNNLMIEEKHSAKMQCDSKMKITIRKIKLKKFSGDTSSLFLAKPASDASSAAAASELRCTMPHPIEEKSPSLSMSVTENTPVEVDKSWHIDSRSDNVLNKYPKIILRTQMKESELPDVATSAHRAQYFRSKATAHEVGLEDYDMDTDDDHLKKAPDSGPPEGYNYDRSTRSSWNKIDSYHSKPNGCSAETKEQNLPKKSNWLLLVKQEEGYRYIPQLGDEVVYLRQGHQDFIDSNQSSQPGPRVYGNKIRAVEVCLVDKLEYTTRSGSGESCCLITLKFIDVTCSVRGQKIQVTLSEMDNIPDFIVEKTWYDSSMERNWSTDDKCYVWWRDDNGQGGAWWEGWVTGIKDKSSDFPGSPWERYHVKYENDDSDYRHCPWELHDAERSWRQPNIGFKSKEEILTCFNKLLLSAHKDKDRYGIIKLNEVSLKLDFMNRFPVPLSLSIIKSRIENDYYRNLAAMKHDFDVMLSNAGTYFLKNSKVLRKINRLRGWIKKIYTN